ncbi:uncharacterized protein EI90DRAFT_3246217 [Cantharellus anzutake]|uniref:uncharacterized protein n=1 Tax=Cantharellus anzutake TaxID=1750568 RepID=UPI00190836B1|nr:uncharacterized protein EI90DRAFT_3246217 [Cantharellus anzutake]KAF8322992.1 hypothetical protein EI90DRAFT_3246217 [Cantharellus anzutake]
MTISRSKTGQDSSTSAEQMSMTQAAANTVSTPTHSKVAHSTMTNSIVSKGKDSSERPFTPSLAFKLPDPNTIMPMPPMPLTPKKQKQSSATVSSSYWEKVEHGSIDTHMPTVGSISQSLSPLHDEEICIRGGYPFPDGLGDHLIPSSNTRSPLTCQNLEALQQGGMNLDSPIPSVTPSSNRLTAQSVSVPSSSCHAVKPYELPDNDQELSETDISLIILLAQAKEFNEAGFYNTLFCSRLAGRSKMSMPLTAQVDKRRERDLVKQAFNAQVIQLKADFESRISAIALEFSGHGCHYSKHQIRSQIIYNLSKPKKTRKPMLRNAWAHAEAEAQRLKDYMLMNALSRGHIASLALQGGVP